MHSEGNSYKPRDDEVGVCPQQQTREMLGVVPGWVQQATRRKTAREPSTRRAPQKRRSEVRTMSHKVIFLGQGTTPARRGAARRRTGKDPPARLLLPGGLTQEAGTAAGVNREFETCPVWVPIQDRGFAGIGRFLKRKGFHWFHHDPFCAMKVRNVSKVGSQIPNTSIPAARRLTAWPAREGDPDRRRTPITLWD